MSKQQQKGKESQTRNRVNKQRHTRKEKGRKNKTTTIKEEKKGKVIDRREGKIT